MKSRIIAIGGYKNTGKDTSAQFLQYLINSPKIFHNYFCYKLLHNIFRRGKFKITSFAHPLKRTLAALLNIDINKFEDRDFKENWYIYFPRMVMTNLYDKDLVISEGKFSRMINNKDLSFLKTNSITIRQLLQVFGTECMRNIFGDKIWILLTLNRPDLIISDLRFKAEHESVKMVNGTTILINREGCLPGAHASEREILELKENNKFDYVIDNDGTLKDLFYKVKEVYGKLR